MNSNSLEAGSRFIASTMHEVRTPLQTIIGTLELLLDTPLNKEQQEYIHQIEFSATSLLGLANDVLDFTKISSNNFKLEPRPFNLIELTERIIDLIAIECFNKKVEVIADIDGNIPKEIIGDPIRIQQVILNLIKNAAKFTQTGYIINRVLIKDKNIYFEVIDSGIGISEDKSEVIFNDFYQIDSSSVRKAGGTGLGLSICKNLVKIMNGKIGVKPNPEGGSIFWFTIPFEVPELKSPEEAKIISKHTDKKILIIDNCIHAAEALKRKLNFYGFEKIDYALTEKEAIEKIKKADKENNSYSIVFVDLILPDIDGWRLASEITSIHESKDMKLFLMVPEGQVKKDAKLKLLDWFTGYIYKPVKFQPLKEILDQAFNSESSKESKASSDNSVSPVQNTSPLVAKGLNILVAEDQLVNQKLLVTFLNRFGATTYAASDGQEVIEVIKNHPEIDIIFMDIFMPVKTGIDATVELRKKNYKGIIIACTANNDEDDFKAYKEIGMNDIVVKPFKKSTIGELLEKWNSVLLVPNAKDMLNLAYLGEKSSELWDIDDFMDTTGDSVEFAISLMDEFLEQEKHLMEELTAELKMSELNWQKIELYTHTLKGSCASVSAFHFAELGKIMNEAAKNKDIEKLREAKVTFEIDFINLIGIVENWKTSI